MHRTNPFAYGKPITSDSLDDLFSHHQTLTGGWSMTSTPPEPEPGTDPPAPPAPPAPPGFTPPATQADLDRIIGDRIARERAKYTDYDDLKAKAEAHDKAVADAMTEAEKAVAEARKEGESSAREQANQRLVSAEARALAAEVGFREPAKAVRLVDLTAITVNAEGEVDAEAVKAKLKELSDESPYLIDDGKKPAPKPDPSQGGGQGGEDKPSVDRGRDMFANRRGAKKPA